MSFRLSHGLAVFITLGAAVGCANAREECHMKASSTRIIDGDKITILGASKTSVPDTSAFSAYIEKARSHMAIAVTRRPACPETVELIFVHLPLITNAPPTIPVAESGLKSELSSPWLKLYSSNDGRRVQAVFLWSERQFLIDQAVLAGAAPVDTISSLSMTQAQFNSAAQDYASTVLSQPSEKRDNALRLLSNRQPAELVWLFRQSWQTMRGPFQDEALNALDDTVSRAAPSYTALTTALIDAWAGSGEPRTYSSVLDLNGVFDTKAYRITPQSK